MANSHYVVTLRCTKPTEDALKACLKSKAFSSMNKWMDGVVRKAANQLAVKNNISIVPSSPIRDYDWLTRGYVLFSLPNSDSTFPLFAKVVSRDKPGGVGVQLLNSSLNSTFGSRCGFLTQGRYIPDGQGGSVSPHWIANVLWAGDLWASCPALITDYVAFCQTCPICRKERAFEGEPCRKCFFETSGHP